MSLKLQPKVSESHTCTPPSRIKSADAGGSSGTAQMSGSGCGDSQSGPEPCAAGPSNKVYTKLFDRLRGPYVRW